MDTRTGKLVSQDEFGGLGATERKHFIPVIRDLSIKEESDKQIRLYAPWACNSGKKFKFCCKK